MSEHPTSTTHGLHHAAYTCTDSEKTWDFYANKLGFPLVRVENHLHGKGWFRHFFFDIGGGECLAFFELHRCGEKSDAKTQVSTALGLPFWANHISFTLKTMEELEAMKKRCAEKGVPRVIEADHDWGISLYMCDPNGIMVEFTVTTKPEEFVQSPEEALRLLRQPYEEFANDVRKEAKDIAHIAV